MDVVSDLPERLDLETQAYFHSLKVKVQVKLLVFVNKSVINN